MTDVSTTLKEVKEASSLSSQGAAEEKQAESSSDNHALTSARVGTSGGPPEPTNGISEAEEDGESLVRPTSAPPLLEELQKAYGQSDGSDAVKPYTDIRLDEDYEEFYKKYSGSKKLPPPVENRHLYAEVATNSPKRGNLPAQGPLLAPNSMEGPKPPEISESSKTDAQAIVADSGGTNEETQRLQGLQDNQETVPEELASQQADIKQADAVLSVGLSRLRIRESPTAADGFATNGVALKAEVGNGPSAEGSEREDQPKIMTNDDRLSSSNSLMAELNSVTNALMNNQSTSFSGSSTQLGESGSSNSLLAEALKGLDPTQAAALAILQGGPAGAIPGMPPIGLGSAGGAPSLAGWEGLMVAAASGPPAGLAAPMAASAASGLTTAAAVTDSTAVPDATAAGLSGMFPMAAVAAAAGLPSAAGIAPSNMHLYEQLLKARLGVPPGMDLLGSLAAPGLGTGANAATGAMGLVPGLEAFGLGGLGATGLGAGMPGSIPGAGGLDLLSAAAALQPGRLPGPLGMPGGLPGGGFDLMSAAATLAALQGTGAPLDLGQGFDTAAFLQMQQIQKMQQLATLQAQLQGLHQPQQGNKDDGTVPPGMEQTLGTGKDLFQSAELLKALQGDTSQQQLMLQLLQQQQQQQQLQLLNQASGLPLGLAAAQMRTLFGPAGGDYDTGLGIGAGRGRGSNMCKFFLQSGFCARGDACPYSHSLTGPGLGAGGVGGMGSMGLGGQLVGTPQRKSGTGRVGGTSGMMNPSADPWQPGYGTRVSPPVGAPTYGSRGVNNQFGAPGQFLMGAAGAGSQFNSYGLGGPGPMDPSLGVMNAYAALQNPMGGFGGYQQGMGVPAGGGGMGGNPALKYSSLAEVEGRMATVARDQHGCRFLQRQFDEGSPEDIERIYQEIKEPLMDLMIDPFGNYLVQKLLEVCTRQQQLEILTMVTARDGELVNISLNMHGTRSVQKLIETVTAPEDIARVTQSLESGVVTLIKDLNGNHVVQRCLQRLTPKQNEFIFKAAVARCVEVATHRHGCCVLQRCIDFADEGQRDRLVAEIASNTLVLAQDPFGNYVVQYILDLGLTWAVEEVAMRVRGQVAQLATQKFSSNVVEKTLKVAPDNARQQIVLELIASPRLGQLLQDPFANYVIQSALSVTKGNLYASFVEAIRPHAQALRSSPYGKRILSKTNLKPR